MKTRNLLLSGLVCGFMAIGGNSASAAEEVAPLDENLANVECKDYYASSWRDNWFIQVGAGINAPFVETYMPKGDDKHHVTLDLSAGFGHWVTPYLALRFMAQGGSLHWDDYKFSKSKYANLNLDLVWDMFNSLGGVNADRVFSINPFIGVGGTCVWGIESGYMNVEGDHGTKSKTWALPVSAGLQFNFRLCKYVDFFLEGRAQFMGDNFNGTVYGSPVDVNITALGGFTFKIGGRHFDSINPCTYLNYINDLNGQVNDLRGELANTAAALAAAEAQLPCPEVKEVVCPDVKPVLLSAVRFNLNSSRISKQELVNIYNVAEWMKANEDVNLVINGYADKKTGTPAYNKKLSEKRAKAVMDKLVEYGVAEDRLSTEPMGDSVQPYESENNWNRVVLFQTK